MNKQIEALLIEREGYLRRGRKDRADAVTASLKDLGYSEPEAERAVLVPEAERAISPKSRKKKS